MIVRGGGCSRSTNPNPDAVGMVSLRLHAVKSCHRIVGVLDQEYPRIVSDASVCGARHGIGGRADEPYDVRGKDAVKHDRQFCKHSTQYAFAKNVFQNDNFVNARVGIHTTFHLLQESSLGNGR